jgi:hypothetical protein
VTNGPDKNSKDEVKGFAGLSSMVSDVDASPVDEGRASTTRSSGDSRPANAAPAPTPEPERPRAQSQAQTQPQPQPQARTGYLAPSQPTGGGTGGKWLIGIAVVFGLIWLSSMSDTKSPATSPSYTTSSSSSSTPASPPAWQAPAAPVQAPSRPSEETPPVGSGNVLTSPQIRYCTAQNIRLDAAKEAVNQYNDSDIDRFNALVADYNSRCSNFRYRKGALESARSEVERFRSDYLDQGRQLFAPSSARPSASPQVRSTPNQPTQPRAEARVPAPDSGNLQLSRPEEESVEAACSSDKYLNGPAAYRACRERQIGQLRNGPRRPDLSGLASAERESIEAACSSDKYLNGPAAYNRCLTGQLSALGTNNRRPSLDSLSSSERESIEAACSSDKYLNGPASYNQCLSNQLSMLARQARRPNLSNLTYSQRQSIEAACSSDKYLNGPAAYNECLARQLQQLR